MFGDSLLESNSHSPAHRGWSTLTAMGLEISALAVLLLFPLLHPAALPSMFPIHESIQISSSAPQVASVPAQTNSGSFAIVPAEALRAPSMVPRHRAENAVAPPTSAFASTCHGDCTGAFGIPNGNGNGAMPILKRPHENKLALSYLEPGQILSQVQPVYPVIAKATHTEGSVLLHAIIGKDGRIENLTVVSGHALLSGAALKAVSQWMFRPYILDGSPIEVETQILVNFKLAK